MEIEKICFDMVIIGDIQRNIRDWIAMGGTGIVHIGAEEAVRQLKEMDVL